MTDYILLMHGDTVRPLRMEDWATYCEALGARGVFRGGSEIGAGEPHRKGDTPATASAVTGYIRIEVPTLADARACLVGNPVYEAGGTVEIRELPRTGA